MQANVTYARETKDERRKIISKESKRKREKKPMKI